MHFLRSWIGFLASIFSREIEQQKDAVLDEVSRCMQQRTESAMLFTLR